MSAATRLRVVENAPATTVEDDLRALLRLRARVEAQARLIEAQMQPLRRRYADDRGEAMLPTIERLKRELKA